MFDNRIKNELKTTLRINIFVQATFQVFYWIGWKPDASQPRPLNPQKSDISLKDLYKLDEIVQQKGLADIPKEDKWEAETTVLLADKISVSKQKRHLNRLFDWNCQSRPIMSALVLAAPAEMEEEQKWERTKICTRKSASNSSCTFFWPRL